jgi:hypothetical protein
MSLRVILTLCWIALGLTALVSLGGAAIGAAYHPDYGMRYLVGNLAPIVVIAGLLGLVTRVTGVVFLVALVATACAGLALIGFFGRQVVIDRGDALLWTPPILLGFGLVGLAAVLWSGPPAGARGRT